MASSMEHSDEFDFSDWLIKALETNLTIDENFNNFASNIYESINQFARLSKDELINNFSQLPKEVNQRLRTTLSFEVLDHIGLESTHTLRNTGNINQILNDLYSIIQLACASDDQIKSCNLSAIYDIKTIRPEKVEIKTLEDLYERLNTTMVNNHSIFVEKLKHSKNIINSQNKKIDSL